MQIGVVGYARVLTVLTSSTVTVSLLANYFGKLMGQVTAGSLKEIGD